MHGKWLISDDYKARMQTAIAANNLPTVDQQRAHREEVAARRATAGAPPNYRVDGSTAYIGVTGLLTAEPDFWADWLGIDNTTYADIAASVAKAESDPAVKNVVYEISSGGGTVDGITDAVYAIDSATKPSSVVSDYAASAAYWIATRAAVGGKIQATSPMASFGSIGVAVDVYSFSFVKQIASTDAPNKRPDVSTEEGRKIIQEELDQIHDHFAGDVADARGVTRETVNASFGRGGMLLADTALLAGMIDEVVARPAPARKGMVDSTSMPKASEPTQHGTAVKLPQAGVKQQEFKSMDLSTLKASHPDVYKAVREEGIAAGVTQERERVAAHFTLAEASGDHAYATKCAVDGTEVSVLVQTTHMAAAMKKGAREARAADDKSVESAASGAAEQPDPNSEAAQLERDNRIGNILNKYAAD